MQTNTEQQANAKAPRQQAKANTSAASPKESGGPKGPEPTRYGDWERKGRCIDF